MPKPVTLQYNGFHIHDIDSACASMEKKDALDWKLHFLHHRRPFPLRPNAQPFQTPRNYSGMSEPLPQSMPPMTD